MQCPSTSATSQECAWAQLSDLSATTCEVCEAGKACYTRDAAGTIDCPEGFYSAAGELPCRPCPAGFECDSAAVTGEVAAGTFSGKGHATAYACPKGFQCPFQDQVALQQCPPGHYSLGRQDLCIECPDNKHCEHRDTVSTLADGFFSPQGTGIALVCPAGWECKHESLGVDPEVVLPCPQGTWSEAGSSTCTPCAAGSACTVSDQSEFQCADGSIQSATGKLHCSPCEPTTYASSGTVCTATQAGEGLTHAHLTPTHCPAGSYSDAATIADWSIPDCQPCDAGALCPESSTTSSAASCPLGSHCNIQDEFSARYAAEPCPLGQYPDPSAAHQRTEAAACTACPAGYYCRACEDDEAGCGDAGTSFAKIACPAGHICPLGTRRSTEYPCPAGTYQPNDGQSDYSACTDCPVGSYCPEGSARHYLCPPGSYCPTTGLKDPQDNLGPAGYLFGGIGAESTSGRVSTTHVTDVQSYSAVAAWSVTTCDEHYCPPGSSRYFPCPAGLYADDANTRLTSKFSCSLCD